jgi:plastocyanin
VNGVRALAAPLLIAGCLAAAGCSNREPTRPPAQGPSEVTVSPGPDGVQQVVVSAGDDYRFTPSIIDATVGKIRLTLRHTGQGAPHTLYGATIAGLRVPLVRSGETRSIQFTASQPGRYGFVCTIHEAQGETGMLVVAPG